MSLSSSIPLLLSLAVLGGCNPDTSTALDEPSARNLQADETGGWPVPGFELDLEVVGDDVVLEWLPQPGAVQYGVFVGAGPYFTPGPFAPQGAVSVSIGSAWDDGTAVTLSFTDTDATTGSGHRFYRIAAWEPDGTVVGYSTIGAAMVQDLVVGKNEVGIPLLEPSVDAASTLAAQLPDATEIQRWDAAAEGLQSYIPGMGDPDFGLAPGEAAIVHMGAVDRYVITGLVPAEPGGLPLNLSVGKAFVAAPLHLTVEGGPCCYVPDPSVLATDVLTDLSPGVSHLREWDPVAQQYRGIHSQKKKDNDDFPVEIGQALWLMVTDPSTW